MPRANLNNLRRAGPDGGIRREFRRDQTILVTDRDRTCSSGCWTLILGIMLSVSTFRVCAQELKSLPLDRIDGVYEFIRDEVTIEEPEKKTIIRESAELTGYWIFKDGFYSETLMFKKRPMWGEGFPRNASDLGYISSAGTYELHANSLKLREALNLNPHFVGRPYWVELTKKGDLLILTERWEPHVENRSKGRRMVTVRKLR